MRWVETSARTWLLLFALLAAVAGGCRERASAVSQKPTPAYGQGSLPLRHLLIESVAPRLAPPSESELGSYEVVAAGPKLDLRTPVKWPNAGERSWQFRVHAWQFLIPWLAGFEQNKNPELLRASLKVALDWVQQHPEAKKKRGQFAWYDMSVASRAALLGYLVRAGGQAGLLTASDEAALVKAAEVHGSYLRDGKNYYPRHNHGLFIDAGLLMLCQQLDQLPDCKSWRRTAGERYGKTLTQTVAKSGPHLEHSPAYHFDVLELTERVLAVAGDRKVSALRDKMRAAAPWLVEPRGKLPMLGDTHYIGAPEWAAQQAASLDGTRFFQDAGYFAVRTPSSQLLVSGGFHSSAHKHYDDLSFVLSERGRQVLIDPGYHSYGLDVEAKNLDDFLESAAAHNSLVVDGKYTLPKPTGSSLLAAGAGAGWQASWGRSPDSSREHGAHERIWLYRPGQLLLLIDDVKGGTPGSHDMVRHFLFAPDLSLSKAPAGGMLVRGPDFEGTLLDASQVDVSYDVVVGRKQPLAGFAAYRDSELVACPSLTLTSKGEDALLLSVFELTASKKRQRYALRRSGAGFELTLGAEKLTLTRRDALIDVLEVKP